MIRLFANANYDFIKWRRWAYGLTAAIIIPGFALFLVRGLNYSIEFTGGTLIQVQTPEAVGTERIRSALDVAGIRDAEIQLSYTEIKSPIDGRIGRAAVSPGNLVSPDSGVLAKKYPMLVKAIAMISSPELRNASTIGGDLLQEVWCQYLRGGYSCWRNGGYLCYGAIGDNSYYHSAMGGRLCYAVYPGDAATALIPLDVFA